MSEHRDDFLAKYGPSEHLHNIISHNDPDSTYWHLLGSHSLDQSHVDRLINNRYRNLHQLALQHTTNPEHMMSAVKRNDHYDIGAVVSNKNATPEVLKAIANKSSENYYGLIKAAKSHPNYKED